MSEGQHLRKDDSEGQACAVLPFHAPLASEQEHGLPEGSPGSLP